jgi:hypothetical protein
VIAPVGYNQATTISGGVKAMMIRPIHSKALYFIKQSVSNRQQKGRLLSIDVNQAFVLKTPAQGT